MVGAVLDDGVTVNRKEVLALLVPSLTVMVMVAVPDWPAAGVTVTVRLAPEPPKTMLALGTRVGLEELPLRERLASGVSGSLMVNGRGEVGVFSGVV